MITQKVRTCSIFYNNICLAIALYMNGHYLLCTDNSILNIETNPKRKREDEISSQLWHYRLSHIGKDRISKLHKDGYLGSFDFELLDQCESCLAGKMTKAPFTGKGNRLTELLGLIHSDV